MPGNAIRSKTVVPTQAGKQSAPIFCPAFSEITTFIGSNNGVAQGAVSIDYTNSADALVANGTASWVGGALAYSTAGSVVQKVYEDCWIRVNGVSGNATVTVDPSGNTITPVGNPFVPISGGGTVTQAEILPGTGNGISDNSPMWAANCGDSSPLLTQTVKVRLPIDGNYLFNSLNDWHPAFGFENAARGGIQVIAGPNLPAVTPGTPGVGTGGGAPAAIFRKLARSPLTPAIQAYEPAFGGLIMDGKAQNQVNPVIGIRVANADPSKNANDPDPNFNTNKDYTSGFWYNFDVSNCSSDGFNTESTQGRCSMLNVRSLGNNGNGMVFSGNDVCVYGHSAAGGNLLFGFRLGAASGFHIGMPNAWGNAKTRSLICGAMWVFQSKLFDVIGGEFNDWVRIDGDNNPAFGGASGNAFFRVGLFMGVNMAPFNELFLSDGVATDTTAGGPDSRLQATFGITQGQGYIFVGNQFTRTTSTNITEAGFPQFPFNTPGNVGGDLSGNYGTAFQYHFDISNGAMVNIIDTCCSAPNVKSWVNSIAALPSFNDPVPINAHGGTANYIFMDCALNLIRLGGRGGNGGSAIHSQIAIGINESAFPNNAYAIEIGDTTVPGGTNGYRNAIYGMTELNNVQQYMDNAFDGRVLTNGQTRAITPADAYQFLSVAGGGIATATVNFPTGLNASYTGYLIFTGGAITALTLGIASGGGSINSNTAVITTIPGGPGYCFIPFVYRHDTNSVYLLGYSGGDKNYHVGRIDGASVPNGYVGEVTQNFVLVSAEVTLTNGVSVNIPQNGSGGGNAFQVTLTPGVWMVSGTAGFDAGAAGTIANVQAGISTTSNTLPAIKDAHYSTLGYPAAGEALNSIFAMLTLGPKIIRITVTTNYYLVVQAGIVANACSAFGGIYAQRIG